jgi:hypothetical protein
VTADSKSKTVGAGLINDGWGEEKFLLVEVTFFKSKSNKLLKTFCPWGSA